ncbi:MAG TPA: TonB-dependent receptor [Candidatus Polarisedimenticolaceae bacterium]|nr:TonB-dependent receptor [Candidatus Polarisedimenticolaceae bacterium]
MRIFVARILALFVASAAAAGDVAPPDLTQIGIEALMDLEVTSVSKRPERRMDAPAAVYVITREDIVRSGVTSIPEALRLAPGVQVARIDANKWAVGVRGFASRLSRSLLVLIDGRSVYSPLFAGVYWEVQDTLLEDVERIEVIRGPGATLWGANAVNGVINIITRDARQTAGGHLDVQGGEEERAGGARYGGSFAGGFGYRAYGKYFAREAAFHSGTSEYDDWRMGQVGFRLDGALGSADTLTVQGDAYDGESGQRTRIASYSPPAVNFVEGDAELAGGNLLARWKHAGASGGELALQLFYDRTDHRELNFDERRDTFDLELQHHAPLSARHELVWGVGYRRSAGDMTQVVPVVEFIPQDRTEELFSAFVQDDVELLRTKLRLTLGSKFEHNDYSGFEVQPNLRLIATPTPRQAWWLAVARALRTPSRIELDASLTDLIEPATPTYVRIVGNPAYRSERLRAYELGYRIEPTERLFVDLAAFYDSYRGLASLNLGPAFAEATPAPPHVVVPLFFENRMRAGNYGAELALEWRPAASWRLAGSYSYLKLDLEPEPGSPDTTTEPGVEGTSPRHMLKLQSQLDLPHRLGIDLQARAIGRLPAGGIEGYAELDLALRWRPKPALELALIGANLLHAHHAEFPGGSIGLVEAERDVQGRLTWAW